MLGVGWPGPCGSRVDVCDAIEAWGGAECTINRVGDCFRDQFAETGHGERHGDLALLASLKLDALRIPVLWERIAGGEGWAWSDRALAHAAERGIRPIVGLVHHGSGPAHTSLLHDDFAASLADHAAEVAWRYPHVTDWTPVNEPLTTARFSALYGLWYPHVSDERTFWLALLNQIDAIRLAMRAVRTVNPAARLIQTEDLGRTYATPALREQAAFDNQRRWMTWDLLSGRVGVDHPLWRRLCGFGFERRLEDILSSPCPPSVIGINHYLTSDRLLDQRTRCYPARNRGGNQLQAYADVEAIRVLDPAPQGLAGAIDEAWQRYRLPIALTEIHNGSTREEQARWLSEAWRTARRARRNGVDICAVTAWALFGSKGWNTLLTSEGGYEAGAFDVSSGAPRETALADVVRSRGGVCIGRPWWRRPLRFAYAPAPRPAPIAEHRLEKEQRNGAALMILGASGTLGQALASACEHRDVAHVLIGRGEVDLCDGDSIRRAIDRHEPWAVINAAGWVRVDDAENHEEACRAANASGAIAVAQACARSGLASVNFSTDLVFDGATEAPYDEAAAPRPLNAYGRSKLEMEERLAGLAGRHLVIRTAAFFSQYDRHNFASHCVAACARGERFAAVADCAVSPTYVPDLCRATLDLLIDRESGLWHLTNGEATTWLTFARRLLAAIGAEDDRLIPLSAQEAGWRAPRPKYSALTSRRGLLMPGLDSAITRFAEAHTAGAGTGSLRRRVST